ncbi:MAG: Secretion system C-terminal sorting domain, partial [Bacteroidota bacterium]
NPTEGMLNIAVQSTNTQDVKVEVYNAMGQFIMVEKFNKVAAGKNNLSLNLNNVPTGLYIVEVTGTQLNETFRVAVK